LQYSSIAKTGNLPTTNYGSYLVKTPSGGIPARSGTTLGSASCTIQVIDKSNDQISDGESVDVLNLSEAVVAGDSYIAAIRTKSGDYIAEAGGSDGSIVIGRHLVGSPRSNYLGLSRDPSNSGFPDNRTMFTGDYGENVNHFLNESNNREVIGPSGTAGRWSLKKAGVYAYSISWSIIIDDPPPADESIGLLSQQVEFSYDVDGHVDGIRNGLSSGGNSNPFAVLYNYPAIDIYAFLYDAARSNPNLAYGRLFGADRGAGGWDTQIRGYGTDSNGDSYGSLWGYYLDSGQLQRMSHGCITGAIAITQENIDNLQGGAAIGVDFNLNATGSSAFKWQYAFGGYVVYSPTIGDMSTNLIDTIFPNTGVQTF
jgi:hypothetical protein